MKVSTMILGLLLTGWLLPCDGQAAWNDLEPEGVFAITPVLERSCVAVRVPVKSAQALVGFRWWNNDAAVSFPRMMVASGQNDYPPLYDDGFTVGEMVGGAETGWSEWYFAEPVGSDTGTLYVIFQLPANMEGVAQGDGPGFGYVPSENGTTVWVSSDGDDWSRFVADYQLLLDPVYTDRDDGTLALKCSRPTEDPETEGKEEADAPKYVVSRTELLAPYPNPFNPSTTISFTLLSPSKVHVALYDLRGRLVKNLLNEYRDQGLHEAVWNGRDNLGMRAASGVYFVRLRADGVDEIRRMLMVK